MWHCGGCDGCVAHRPVWDALLVSRSAAVLPPLSRVTVRTRPIPDVDLWSGHVSISDVTRIHLHESARTPRYQGNYQWSWYFRKKCLIYCITYRRSAPNPIVDSIECHELGLIKTAEQRTIIQHGDWYTGRWLVGCYLAPPSPLLAVPNVTTHSSTTSIPTSYDSM